MYSHLAQAVRAARRSCGLTQKQLGMRLGLKGRAVYRWERDEAKPSRRHRWALVVAVRAVNAEAAEALANAIRSIEKKKGQELAVAAPAPPARAVDANAFERAVFALADELDLAPRRVRVALGRLFERTHEAGFSLESAQRHLDAWLASGSAANVEARESAREQNLDS